MSVLGCGAFNNNIVLLDWIPNISLDIISNVKLSASTYRGRLWSFARWSELTAEWQAGSLCLISTAELVAELTTEVQPIPISIFTHTHPTYNLWAFKPVAVCGTTTPLVDHLVTTWWPLADYLVTTWWPLDDHLLTSWWPLDDRLMTACWPLGHHYHYYTTTTAI